MNTYRHTRVGLHHAQDYKSMNSLETKTGADAYYFCGKQTAKVSSAMQSLSPNIIIEVQERVKAYTQDHGGSSQRGHEGEDERATG